MFGDIRLNLRNCDGPYPERMMQPERSAQSFGYKYRQNSFTYDVKRDVYNEETFQQEHRRKSISSGNLDIDITTFRHHVQCRCSWHKFLRCILTIFPFLEWVCLYRFKDWLIGDLLAGISVGCVQVPQVLTFSLLTRQLIPPLNVCYAAFCSSLIYVIFGSCHQMSIGSFFLVSALMINVLRLYPFNSGHLVLGTFIKEDFSAPSFLVDYNRSLSVVASTTFLTGIIQLSMGLLGFGFLATYLPEAAISAYLAAVALHVILSQLTCIFGIMIGFHSGPISFFYNIVNYCATLPKANSTSILLFLTAVVALRINKCIRISFNRYPIEFPMEVLLILGFAAFANKITMATETSKMLIDMIPYSFLFPVTPDLNILPELILEAFSLALVSSSLLIFLGKKIASYHNYHVNSNQDLIAIGLCNVVSSFFRSCVFTGAIVRTIIQDKSGGRQQFASLVGAGVMLLLMVKVGRFFNELPNAVLAGIILSNILPYLEIIYNLPSLWRQNQYDCIIWLVTFTSAIFLGLDVGLLVSIAFAFFIITVRSHRTKILLLGQIPNTNIYRSFNDYREVTNLPGLKIFQCCNSITFVNVDHLKHKLLKEVEMVRVPLKEEEMFRLFNQSEEGSQEERICQCFCNCDELEPPPRMCNAFQNANILVLISGCHSSVVRAFERNDFFDAGITKAQLFLTLHDAVLFALSRKFPESSELSMDESETVIQETFSETDKNEESKHKMSSGLLEVSKNINPDYTMMQRPITEEDLELDLELEPTLESEQETGLDLELDLDHEMEPESELELEPEPELGPRLEMEPESESMPRPRAQTFPRQQYWPLYQSMPPGSPSQARPRTQSLERRHQGLNSYSPKGNNT
ncbi:testis anion transporter 1 isoform X7 [Canis lupus baileyi]|uniref:testis anion transporter 1 isoform X6 n=1 Tax=Canis lupus familiaris TaxID=9615 RepID=UPI000BAA0F7E|nr:testis anion transporter 1 isoform X6 [Canis lupus familiaris]XP_025274352.1 testis anion transporter 1 isoform X7 [Canis lupus dingo]XP_038409785.1 testis anion transporter 1 isoform X6 [Canis lupus familiaris]XP_038539239.1 testis anion transporter 1 isoform X6 [Canis lupus familiaris]|eukprot:XP_022281684.1 testis anion transporter 1 isoform X6 [Canis lupus familiaris]